MRFCDRGSEKESLKISVIREPSFTPMTVRKRDICWDFGIPPRETPFTIVEDLDVEFCPGRIILLTGASGSGKSSILHRIAEQAGDAVWVGRGRFPTDRAIVDAIAPRKPLALVLEILTACGLGEPRLWIRSFNDLSDGEKFRASLARAVGASLSGKSASPIFCDEFTAILHRRMAKAIAYNLRKLVSRTGLVLVVATTHADIVSDLQPDQIIRLGGSVPEVQTKSPRKRAMSLQRSVDIVRGSVKDYRAFSPMHYRNRDGLGFVDKVFLLKEKHDGTLLGILVFAHAPMELSQRNRSTNGRFVRNLRRLNKELRILRRLVMHPDVRGCGLGHWFVRKTMPKVGVRFVECLAAMGAVNPVFERAGMVRVGRCPLPKGRLTLLKRMQEWRVDPFATGFVRKIAKYPRVRQMVEKTVQDWIDATHGGSKYEVKGRPALELAQAFRQLLGEPPMYYLWDSKGQFPRGATLVSEGTVSRREKRGKQGIQGKQGKRSGEGGERDPQTTRTTRSAPRHSPLKKGADRDSSGSSEKPQRKSREDGKASAESW